EPNHDPGPGSQRRTRRPHRGRTVPRHRRAGGTVRLVLVRLDHLAGISRGDRTPGLPSDAKDDERDDQTDDGVSRGRTERDEGCACENSEADEAVAASMVAVSNECRAVQAVARV